jgi:3-deoxy-D-manno-octulosonic-acid transferase
MALIIYTILTRLYFLAISFSALFSPKARFFKRGRKNLLKRLKKEITTHSGDYIWFHCASLGEFEQGRPVIEAFKNKFPSHKIILTFFSPSGYEIRKNYQHADLVFYLPEDSAENAVRFLDLVKPKLVLFIKYEYWYYIIKEIHNRNIPLLSISSIFRKEQLFFKPYGKFYRKILRNFHHFFVQDEYSFQLLKEIGIESASVAGDTRFDRVFEISNNIKSLPEIKNYINDGKVLVAGSIWKEDLQVIVALARAYPDFKIIIAPHELKESFITEISNSLPNSSRFSKGIQNDRQVLIIDNIGLLSSLYQFADYAFIGGAFGKGLHNILEAATFGMPIFFGNKKYIKFVEAKELINNGGAFAVADFEELKKLIDKFEKHPQMKKEVGELCRNFVKDHTGATEKILEYSGRLLKGQL